MKRAQQKCLSLLIFYVFKGGVALVHFLYHMYPRVISKHLCRVNNCTEPPSVSPWIRAVIMVFLLIFYSYDILLQIYIKMDSTAIIDCRRGDKRFIHSHLRKNVYLISDIRF